MTRALIITAFLFAASSAAAQQQQLDPALMQRTLEVVAAQRNNAMNAAAVTEAKAAGLAEELAKANARLKELEPKPDAPAK
jgi:hypothetical protein